MLGTVAKRVLGTALALGVALIIGFRVQPATAHIGTPLHLWTVHIRPKADARYLQNTHVYRSAEITLSTGSVGYTNFMCPSGMQALGGGIESSGSADVFQLLVSAPLVNGVSLFSANQGRNPAANGWRVGLSNDSGSDVHYVIGVVCSR